MVIKLTKQLKPDDPDLPLQLYSILNISCKKNTRVNYKDSLIQKDMMFRKFLRILNLKQIGRHFYDPSLSQSCTNYNVEIWPGYPTTCLELTRRGRGGVVGEGRGEKGERLIKQD